MVVLLTIGIALIGAVALQRLPIDAVPDITNNQVQINTEYPALSPEEIEKQVTFPLEYSLAGIPGLEYTRSISRNGFSQVTAVFRDDVDIYFARQQVNERLTEARENLPEGAEPRMGPISTGLGEVYMYVVEYEHPEGNSAEIQNGQAGWQKDNSYLTPEGERLYTEVEKAGYLRTVQDWIVIPSIRTVNGVAGVDSIGGYVKQYIVEPDPLQLVSYGLTFDDVLEALEKNNQSIGASYIENRGESYTVRSDGRVENTRQIADIVVGSHEGTPIYVSDIANVGIGRELRTGSASEGGHEVVVGTTLMLIGGNSRTVAADVDKKIREIRHSLPPGVNIRPVLDRSTLVDATIKTVEKNLSEGAILVIIILFLFLGSFRAAFITALAIPLSMLMASIGMVRFGISGNLMSLGAIDFGIIVDGAVIIVENCLRRLGEKQHELKRNLTLRERIEIVFGASKEVRGATAFGEAIIITVYIPILFLTGVEGKMFHPMAMTVIFALVGAFILSLTFIPAMVALVVRGRVTEKENFIIRSSKSAYQPILAAAVRFPWAVVGIAFLMFLGSLFVFQQLGQVFVPKLDEGNIALHSLRMTSTGITKSSELQLLVEKTISEFPEVEFAFSKTGTAEVATDPMPPNVSDGFVILKPKDQWPNPNETKEELRQRIGMAVKKIPGQMYEFTQPIEMRFNELIAGVRGDLVMKIYGDEFEKLTSVAQQIAKVLRDVEGASDIKLEQTKGLPFLDIDVRRSTASRYGLNISDIQNVISIAIGGQEAGEVYQGDRRFDILVRLPDEMREDVQSLEHIPVPLPPRESMHSIKFASLDSGFFVNEPPQVVPLGVLADIRTSEGPNQISRENSRRRTYVAANVRGRDLGSFVEEVKKQIASNVQLPPGYFLEYGGQYENLARARDRLAVVVPVCFFLIFLLLFSTFNSVKSALLVFTAVPLALTGGVVSLWLRGMPFSISAAVGFIAVSGVAVLNGLVMITYINQLRRRGSRLETAIKEGAITRLRPVIMTALVASLGFLPMALSTGRGAEVQQPLATVVIGGLVTSTLLTLVVLPALYRIWHSRDEMTTDDLDRDNLTDSINEQRPIGELA